MSWQITLKDILSGYFSDQSVEEGVTEMIFVTAHNPDYHQSYFSAIKVGMEAASRGETEVFDIVSSECYVKDIADVQKFLEKLCSEYMAQYEAATSDNVSEPTN
ncbi:hypothetical protein [Trichocoleus sp. DQ-U1]|uniref:hypothetical protein n=1 Tax=Trichocoleus sp. DQ-U1 TaxID=2933926 RepID=UPI003299AF81